MMSAVAQTEYRIALPALVPYQRDAFFGPHRFLVCEASTKVGKTYCSAKWQFGLLVDPSGKNNIHWWVAPSHASARMTYERVKKWINEGELVTRGVFKTRDQGPRSITYVPTGAVWEFHTGEKPDALYGNEVDSLVLDEASRCRAELWDVLESVIGPRLAPVRMIGNVKNKVNWNYHLCRQVEAEQHLPPEEREFPDYLYAKMTIWDAVEAGIFDKAEALRKKAQLVKRGLLAIWNRDYLADCEGTGTAFIPDEIQAVQLAAPVETGAHILCLDAGGKKHPAGIVVIRCSRREIENDEGDAVTVPALEVVHAEHWGGPPTQFEARALAVADQWSCDAVTLDNYMPLLVARMQERFGAEHTHSKPGTKARRWAWYLTIKDAIGDGTLRIDTTAQALLADMGEVALDSDDPEVLLMPEYTVDAYDDETGQMIQRVVHVDAFDAFIRGMEIVGDYATGGGIMDWYD